MTKRTSSSNISAETINNELNVFTLIGGLSTSLFAYVTTERLRVISVNLWINIRLHYMPQYTARKAYAKPIFHACRIPLKKFVTTKNAGEHDFYQIHGGVYWLHINIETNAKCRSGNSTVCAKWGICIRFEMKRYILMFVLSPISSSAFVKSNNFVPKKQLERCYMLFIAEARWNRCPYT